MELMVNGEIQLGEVVLQAEDQVVVRGRTEEEPGRIEVEVAADGMAAWVTVHAGRRTIFTLPDVPPAPHIDLRAQRRDEPFPHTFSPTDVLEALGTAGVRVTPDPDAIRQALTSPGTRVLVAEGRPPRSGRPAKVWTLLHGELSAPPDGSIDLSPAEGRRAFADIGTPLARVEPGDAERAGRTVTGAPIPAAPTWQPALVPGPGTLLSADGRTVIAATSGHPLVEVQRDEVYVSVFPEMQIAGDLDEAHGNVDFDGDVWVGGDVQVDRTLYASGSVEVAGRVLRARIEARGAVLVHRGAAASLLIAGGPGLTYARALVLCEALTGALSRGSHQPPTALAFQIYQELSRTDVRLDAEVRALEEHLERLALRRGVAADGRDRATHRLVEALAETLPAAIACMRQSLARPGRCFVRHLDQTKVEASGDVEIGDAGAIRSSVTSLGEVRVAGAFRGGSVWALRGARFGTVGLAENVPTRIQIGPRARFVAAEVRPGTTVLRGETVLGRFTTAARDVVFDPPEQEP